MNIYINLNDELSQRLPCLDFKMLKFPGGELHIKLDNNIDYDSIDKVIIVNRFSNSDDIIKVLLAKDALERKGIFRFELIMPYIPYARQDRQCCDGEAFSLEVFAKIINSMEFEKVTTLDAHSEVAVNLIDNCENFTNFDLVKEAVKSLPEASILISPDEGAKEKAKKLYGTTDYFSDLITCSKERDPETGRLSNFKVDIDFIGYKDCIIVDDICDGGGTFIGIAKELQKKGIKDLYLFITHGIFSKGTDELAKYFTRIFCTNSVRNIDSYLIKQYKI